MAVESLMVGIAVLTIVVAYVARPFRRVGRAVADPMIESWVARLRTEDPLLVEQGRPKPDGQRLRPEAMNYCPQCGRRVEEDDRFCSGCGKRLRGEGEA